MATRSSRRMLLLLIWLGGCTATPPARPADEVTILLEAEIRHLDPRLAMSAYSIKACHLIHAGLVSEENDAAEPRLALAESMEQPDPLTYEFRLRPDLRFHDGSPLTAADVVWTYRSLGDSRVRSPYAGQFDRLSSVEALDERRVRFTLREVHAPFFADLTQGIVPERLTRPTGLFPDGQIIGAGPYRVVRGDRPGELELERSDQWSGPQPRLRRVVLRTLPDANTRLLALMGGSGDLVQNGINPNLLPVLEQHPRLTVRTAPSIAYNYLGFNLEDPVLGRLRVRQAIAHALDIPSILKAKFHGTARPATGLLPPGHWAWCGDVVRYPHDPTRARQLLDEDGLTDPDGPDGPRPRFTLILKTTTDRFRRSVARVLAHQLGEVGIAVEVRSFEWGTFFADIRAGNFQLYTLQWPSVIDPDLYRWIFHSAMIPTPANQQTGANRGRYRNPEVDRLIELGRIQLDREERRATYCRIQQLLAAELPYISLWHEDNVAVHDRNLEGYLIQPNARYGGILPARWAR